MTQAISGLRPKFRTPIMRPKTHFKPLLGKLLTPAQVMSQFVWGQGFGPGLRPCRRASARRKLCALPGDAGQKPGGGLKGRPHMADITYAVINKGRALIRCCDLISYYSVISRRVASLPPAA